MKKNLLIILLFNLTFGYAQISKSDFENIVLSYKDSVETKKFGINCLYQNSNGEVFYQGIGYADEDTLVNRNNVFSIGSLSKTFTAVMVLQDIENGKISLNDSLIRFFTEELFTYPKDLDKSITVKELLSQRSGILRTYKDDLNPDIEINPFHPDHYEFGFDRIEYDKELRGKYSYANTNYTLLGYILEIINNKPLYYLLQKRIIDKLEMKNAYGFYSPTLPNAAQVSLNGDFINSVITYNSYNHSIASGGLSMDIDDINKFLNALYFSEDLLTDESKKEMFSFGNASFDYGLGIMKVTYALDKDKTRIVTGHAGAMLSSQTLAFVDSNTKEVFILLSNSYGDEISNKILYDLIKFKTKKVIN